MVKFREETRLKKENEAKQKLKDLYGDKVILNSFHYDNQKSLVDFKCEKHGIVKVQYRILLRGFGCPECTKKRIESTFIAKAKPSRRKGNLIWRKVMSERFKDKPYDYSQTDFDHPREDGKVAVYCHALNDDGTEHGIFWVNPYLHKCTRKGCPKCAKITTKQVIERFKKIHGDKYDYSLVEYKKMHDKVDIICKKCHNVFSISPANHLKGKGCPHCAIESIKNKLRLSLKIVEERINKVFNGKYRPVLETYVNVDTPMKCICPEHGEFWQKPYALFQGYGCQRCGETKLENEIDALLTKANVSFEREVASKKFKWLLNNKTGSLSLDFYLPEYKIGIECQGLQHFQPVQFGGDEEEAKKRFQEGKKRDEEKKFLCEKNGVKLLYYSNLNIEYPYKVFTDCNLLLNEIKK